MISFDTVLTFLIVAAAAGYLVKIFFGGKGCTGCSCGCGDECGTRNENFGVPDWRSDKNVSDQAKSENCKCSGE
ncbi:MAG: hypothetical protein KQH63_00345 [Desulfobulbaceae bacterium]|nr:hypothetical protein [Desulfobulbaceae bacterium]